MKKYTFLPIILLLFIHGIVFRQFIFQQQLPIPADTIIGLYHPFRDLYRETNPNGIAYKNFLITDPVRQQYPWRILSVEKVGLFSLPLWNPYVFAGMPLFANLQSAVLYPFNILFFFFSQPIAWSMLILLQPILSSAFLYFYLKNKEISKSASLFGAIIFVYSGFSVAWMEWGTIGHVALWLPIILLSIDKIFSPLQQRSKFSWFILFSFSFIAAFFAGHLQTFFYVFLITVLYLIITCITLRKFKELILFLGAGIIILVITSVQWYPLFQLITLSARNIDQANWQREGWFIPWIQGIQFFAPDFFGNPTTLNYWGAWNYGEFIGYIGVIPLLFALYAIAVGRRKIVYFYTGIVVFSLLFAFPTLLAKIPYLLNIPFFATSQPTRLLFLTNFSLAILAAFGFDFFLKQRKKHLFVVLFLFLFIYSTLWISTYYPEFVFKNITEENIAIAKRNLILPTSIFGIALSIISICFFIKRKKMVYILSYILIFVALFDQIRFADKFLPFSDKKYLFPQTKSLSFLKANIANNRIMTTDAKIFPPNFSVMYKIQSIDGYDPLYLRHYAEYITALQRNKPDITPPYGFERIITPHDFSSPFIDLLGVKYIVSLSEITSPKLTKVFEEGQTQIYENKRVLPRVFFVEYVDYVKSNQDAITKLYRNRDVLHQRAVVNSDIEFKENFFSVEDAEAIITHYSEDHVTIKTINSEDGFLVFTDIFYPTWKVSIVNEHGKKITTNERIYQTDYIFRGIIIPKGKYTVEFYNSFF